MNPSFTRTISMLFIMAVVFFVFHFSITSYYFNNAAEWFEQSQTLEPQEKSKAYNEALKHIGYVLKLRPNYAKALDLKAQLLFAKWQLNPDDGLLTDSLLLKEAKIIHEKVLTMGDESLITVLQLAQIEARKTVLDEIFYQRFDQAYKFRESDPDSVIAFDLVKLGVSRWNELNADVKDKIIVLTNISIQQERNSISVIRKVLSATGLEEFMCSRVEKNERQAYICNGST